MLNEGAVLIIEGSLFFYKRDEGRRTKDDRVSFSVVDTSMEAGEWMPDAGNKTSFLNE